MPGETSVLKGTRLKSFGSEDTVQKASALRTPLLDATEFSRLHEVSSWQDADLPREKPAGLASSVETLRSIVFFGRKFFGTDRDVS